MYWMASISLSSGDRRNLKRIGEIKMRETSWIHDSDILDFVNSLLYVCNLKKTSEILDALDVLAAQQVGGCPLRARAPTERAGSRTGGGVSCSGNFSENSGRRSCLRAGAMAVGVACKCACLLVRYPSCYFFVVDYSLAGSSVFGECSSSSNISSNSREKFDIL